MFNRYLGSKKGRYSINYTNIVIKKLVINIKTYFTDLLTAL